LIFTYEMWTAYNPLTINKVCNYVCDI
jgi:hypothetical protein